MAPESIKTLIVEDNPADARLLRIALTDAGVTNLELVQTTTLSESLSRVTKESFDVVLLDLGLPDSKGLETYEQVRQSAPELPIVVLTGLTDEQTGVDAVKAGAQDYLIKGTVDGRVVARSLRYAIERRRLIKELLENIAKRKEAEDELRKGQTTHLWQSLYRILGRGASAVLYQAGFDASARTIEFVRETWRPQGEADLIEALRDHLMAGGICEILDFKVNRESQELSIRVRKNFEIPIVDPAEEGPRCHFLRGLLCGLAGKLIRQNEFVCNELSCEGQGKEACTFLVYRMFR